MHDGAVKKTEAITRLKPLERRLRERGINALYLLGWMKCARGNPSKILLYSHRRFIQKRCPTFPTIATIAGAL
jgi:hypothetical protein